VAHCSASGIGSLAGGSIWNVAAVRQVIEKLPTVATSATSLSSPIVFFAAAQLSSLSPLLARFRSPMQSTCVRAHRERVCAHLCEPGIARVPVPGDGEVDDLLFAAGEQPGRQTRPAGFGRVGGASVM
jgi:hypothetical protein